MANGFEVAELTVLADGSMVDKILLARIDPAMYRFHVYNASAGNRELGDWMKATGAVLVINGSYYARGGTPDTRRPVQTGHRHGRFCSYLIYKRRGRIRCFRQ